jgi:hypothetical protein
MTKGIATTPTLLATELHTALTNPSIYSKITSHARRSSGKEEGGYYST